MTTPSLAPRQARSRESEKKLMKATVDLLGRLGLEGATIPRVAELAGLTPGAVYRRFPDKNALMERVILRIIEDQTEHLQRTFTLEIASKSTLAALVEELVRTTLVGYRRHATLLTALRQFVQGSDHRAFKRKAAALETRNLEHVVEMLMTHRNHVRHPDPKTALLLAFVMLTGTLVELFLSDDNMENWQHLIPNDNESLVRELTRMFLSYIDAV